MWRLSGRSATSKRLPPPTAEQRFHRLPRNFRYLVRMGIAQGERDGDIDDGKPKFDAQSIVRQVREALGPTVASRGIRSAIRNNAFTSMILILPRHSSRRASLMPRLGQSSCLRSIVRAYRHTGHMRWKGRRATSKELPQARTPMTSGEAGERYDRLLTNLLRAETLMRDNHRELWANWMATSRRYVEAGDAYGLDHLLQAFGGMGSFNDIVFHQMNGDQVDHEEADRLNQLHAELGNALYSDAKALQHDFKWV